MPRCPLGSTAALAVLVASCQSPEPEQDRREVSPTAADTAAVDAPGFLYGRVTTTSGAVYQGRLRWGGGEEAFWNDTFNGVKDENPWAAQTPLGAEAERPARLFGIEVPWGKPALDLGRPFMARFGDIARIESRGDGVQGVVERGAEYDPTVRVTLKSGAVSDLDRLSSSDFDDGVRVWDGRRGVVDLGPREIRSVEFVPTPPLRAVPRRLYGTVRTPGGAFTGFLQWDRELATDDDELVGPTAEGGARVRLGAVRAIRHQPDGGLLVALRDGREVQLAAGVGGRGVYVHDDRYGRVLVPLRSMQRVDFARPDAGASGPGYGDFAPGAPLAGRVTTRDGRTVTGRIVYDLDEAETTETLDAPAAGVDYSVPFGWVASVTLPARTDRPARVVLRSGETLALDRAGDLGDGNAGVLVFPGGAEVPEYLPWSEVARIEFDLPASGDVGQG